MPQMAPPSGPGSVGIGVPNSMSMPARIAAPNFTPPQGWAQAAQARGLDSWVPPGLQHVAVPPGWQHRPEWAQHVAQMGRGGDTQLAHVTPQEGQALERMGGAGSRNPQTGMREFFPTNLPNQATTNMNPMAAGNLPTGMPNAAQNNPYRNPTPGIPSGTYGWNQRPNSAAMGRGGDSQIMPVNQQQIGALQAAGGAGTVNPGTGLREFYPDTGPGLGAPPPGGPAPGGPPGGMTPPDGGPPGQSAPPSLDDAMAAVVQNGMAALNPMDIKTLSKLDPGTAHVLSKIFGMKAIMILESAGQMQDAGPQVGPGGGASPAPSNMAPPSGGMGGPPPGGMMG